MRLRDRAYEQGMQFQNTFSSLMKEGFGVLQETTDKFEARIWENIRDCLAISGLLGGFRPMTACSSFFYALSAAVG